jgi:hypothetical protein
MFPPTINLYPADQSKHSCLFSGRHKLRVPDSMGGYFSRRSTPNPKVILIVFIRVNIGNYFLESSCASLIEEVTFCNRIYKSVQGFRVSVILEILYFNSVVILNLNFDKYF